MENFWVMNDLAVPELRAAPVPVWHKLPAPRPAPTACCVAGAGVGVGGSQSVPAFEVGWPGSG